MTNPGLTNTHKQVWICNICYKQIHVTKQMSIRCNRIEHGVHLRCADIRHEKYTDTWTCHIHRESRLTTHTDITPPHPSSHHYVTSVTLPYAIHIISSTAPTYTPHCLPWICGQTPPEWTEKLTGGPQGGTSRTPPLAMVMGVGRQQHQEVQQF